MSALDGRQKMYPVFTRDTTRTDVPQLPSAAAYGEGWADVDGDEAYSNGVRWRFKTGESAVLANAKPILPAASLGMFASKLSSSSSGFAVYEAGGGDGVFAFDSAVDIFGDGSIYFLKTTNGAEGGSTVWSVRATLTDPKSELLGSPTTWDLSAADGFNLWLYCDSDLFGRTSSPVNFSIHFGSGAGGFTNTSRIPNIVSSTNFKLRLGWNNVRCIKSQFVTENGTGVDWSVVGGIQLRCSRTSAYVANTKIWFGGLVVGDTAKAKFVMTLDDSRSDQLDMVRLFNYYGIPCTLYVQPDQIGTSGYLTWDQVRQLQAAGNDIGIHHASVNAFAEDPTRILTVQATLNANGIYSALNHVSFPNGGYNDDTLALLVEHGFASGATIEFGAGQSSPFTVYYTGFSGYPNAATNGGSMEAITGGGLANRFALMRAACAGKTSAQINAWVDNAILVGSALIPYVHLKSEMSMATIGAVAAHVASKVAAGDLEVMTMSRFISTVPRVS
jgi:hypothetical protein